MPEAESDRTDRRHISRGDLRRLGRLRDYLRPYRPQMAGALAALVIAASTVLAIGTGLRHLIDAGFGSGDAGLLDQSLLVMLAVVVLLAAATYGRFYLVSWLGERLVADIRRALYGRLMELDVAFYERTSSGELLSRLTTDTTILQEVIGSSVSVALRNLLLLAGGLVMLAVTSPKLSAIVVLAVPVVVVPIVVFGRKVRRLSRASQERLATVSAYGGESLGAMRTVQAFTHESLDRERFAERVEDAFAMARNRISARAALTALVMVLVFSAVGGILWIGGRDVISGEITAGELSAFVFYAIVVAGAAGALSEVAGDLNRAAGASERIFDLLAIQPAIREPERPVTLPLPARGDVAFADVTFHYASRPERPALADFSLSVKSGECVALVGPSGSGKTTVFNLLLRFYDPERGTIRLDGVDLKTARPADIRSRIGIVPQDPVIFSADAWENISYGRPGASEAEIRAAADAAQATGFIDRLPQGFSTFLGMRGVRLSGGQAQRIAIARALLRNPSVLLLDEATSALDSESERAVQAALAQLMVGRTTLVIAHRLSTVLRADRIVVLDDGRIDAIGTHAELLERSALYARLAKLQFDVARSAGMPAA
ncbi:MAG: ABC transporter transmembrane domain-containing protein [Alphaproteobacteria bacterium]